jgi:hypothetical protein
VTSAKYELGIGLAAEGRYTEARVAATALVEERCSDTPAWLAQGNLLCTADVLALAADRRAAYSTAKKGTSGRFSRLHHPAYAGQFARWVALLGIRDAVAAEALDRLSTEFPEIDVLDLKDQAEVLAAFALLEGSVGRDNRARWSDVERRLNKLPPGIGLVMRRIGDLTGSAKRGTP